MKVAILGGGLTGLCAALRLKEANLTAISELVILEEQPYPGGLLHTTYQKGYWWDNGVFVFNRSNYLCQLLPDLFQPADDLAQKAWINGEIHDFPLAKRLILKQSKFALLASGFDYPYSYVRCALGWDGVNLHDWLRYRLTSRLLNISQLKTYVSKLQGLPLTELSQDLGKSRLRHVHEMTRPGRLLQAVLASPDKVKRMKLKGDPIVYPYGGGVGKVARELAELGEMKGVKIIYGARVKELKRNENGFEIGYDTQASPAVYQADFVISTIPLEELAAAHNPDLSEAARSYARQLEYMDLKLLFFLVKRPLIHHKFFILYSLEDRHQWKRLLCLALPEGLNAVTVEIAYNPKAGQPSQNVEELVMQQLTEELRLFEPEEVALRHSTVVRRAYPIYNLGFEDKVKAIIDEVESDRLRLAGRQGRFLYVTTPGAIQSAMEAADKIVQGIAAAANP